MNSRPILSPVKDAWPELHGAIHRSRFDETHTRVLELLLSGADLLENAQTHSARDTSVLHTATNTSVEVIDLLMAHGAGAILENKCGTGEEGRWAGHTALQMSAKIGRRDIAKRLIKHGADYDVFSAVALGDLQRVAELLDQDDNVLASKDAYQATLLHWSVALDQRETSEWLLHRGLPIDAHDGFEETPLLVASARQSAQAAVTRFGRDRLVSVSFDSLVGLLLDHGAAVDVFAAAALGDVARLEKILADRQSLGTHANSYGTTPLHWSARNGQLESARQLIDRGADIDAQDAIGCSPLWYAAYWGGTSEMVHFLCSQGADVSLPNIWGKDLAAYDCGHGNAAIIRGFRK